MFLVFLLLAFAFLFALASTAAATCRRLLLLSPKLRAIEADGSAATVTDGVGSAVGVTVIVVAVIELGQGRLNAPLLERFGNGIFNADRMIICERMVGVFGVGKRGRS